ncbi:hypothetical protein RB195_019076 [Necator americanus]|uniref:E3 ubiquitin-protein ligase n=1 Tax=Necator americanus TaxID=51031 RepID=A0ABR1CFE4_NECAM
MLHRVAEIRSMREFTVGPPGISEGTVKVVVKLGNITEEKVDVICVSVGSTLEHSRPVWNALAKACGTGSYKSAYENARGSLTSWLSRGEILVVDTSKSKLSANYVFLVVHPDVYHLEHAYRNIFREAASRGCKSVAVPGLGCGLIGNSAHASCLKACEVLHQTAIETLGSIQLVVFIDVKENVVQQFIAQMQAKFESMSSANERGSDFESFAKPPTNLLEDDCVICLCPLFESGEVSELPCAHQFHKSCLEEFLRNPSTKKRCPLCLRYLELPLGNQPSEARMSITKVKHIKLPGHEDCGFVYEITYNVPNGIQDETHIRPGKPYKGTFRRAYVPGTSEGTKVLRLLKFAFDRRLIFTVGDSLTTGAKNTVVWNNIHHKTNISGGPLHYGYPDPDYLSRVKEDLSAMGVTEDMVPDDMDISFS